MKPIVLLLLVLPMMPAAAQAPPTGAAGAQEGEHAVHHAPGVETPNSTAIDAAAYNRIIQAQGPGYYCASGACDEPPAMIAGYAPVYPPELVAAGITGMATIVFTIDEQGRVTDSRVESATRPEFSEASIQALSTWRFKPATRGGAAVRMVSRQQFPFELR